MNEMILNQVLLGKYRIERFLGNGTFGSVFKAQDVFCDRPVAIKALQRDRYDERSIRYVLDEMRFMGKLWGHPNIVAVHTVEPGDEECVAYIVMEYVDGGNLKRLISSRSLSLEETIRIGVDICSALQHAHKLGIIHRDIKPQNILIDSSFRAKLTDFSVARAAEQSEYLHTIVGTRRYMAPEQLRGNYDHRADIYSVGIILHEMATGSLPFPSDETDLIEKAKKLDEVRISDDLPDELADIIRKALDPNPKDRYQSVADLIEDLERVREKLFRDRVYALRSSGEDPRKLLPEIASRLGFDPKHAAFMLDRVIDEIERADLESRIIDEYRRAKEELTGGDRSSAGRRLKGILRSVAPDDSTADLIEDLMVNISKAGDMKRGADLRTAIQIIRSLSQTEFNLLKEKMSQVTRLSELESAEGMRELRPGDYRRMIREYRKRGDRRRVAELYMDEGRSLWDESRLFRARRCYRKAAKLFRRWAEDLLKDGPSADAAKLLMSSAMAYKSGGRRRKGRKMLEKSASVYRSLAEKAAIKGEWASAAQFYLKAADAYQTALKEIERRGMTKKAITAYYTAAQIALEDDQLEEAYTACRQAVNLSSGMGRWSPADQARRLLATIESKKRRTVES